MPPSGKAIAAPATNHMSLPGNQIAGFEIRYIASHFINDPDKFMADGKGSPDRSLSPFIPFIDMNIGTADRCFPHLYPDIVDSGFRNRHLVQPDSESVILFY